MWEALNGEEFEHFDPDIDGLSFALWPIIWYAVYKKLFIPLSIIVLG